MLKSGTIINFALCFATVFLFNCSGQKSKIQEQNKNPGASSAAVEEKKKDTAVDTTQNQFTIAIKGYKATPLGQAVYSGDLAKAKDLLKNGASFDKCLTDETYVYDIMYASINFGKVDIFKYVLANKLYESINQTYTEESETPLTLACNIANCKEAMEIADSLVMLGANVNGAGPSGGDRTMYPLINAVNNNNAELVEFLVKHGANKDITNESGETPLGIAQKKEFKNIVDILQ